MVQLAVLEGEEQQKNPPGAGRTTSQLQDAVL